LDVMEGPPHRIAADRSVSVSMLCARCDRTSMTRGVVGSASR
jgi:hypothetical protein